MYRHLLVGLDGSHAAERVLDHAEALANAFGATITLVQVIESVEMLLAETSSSGPAAMGDVSPYIDPEPIVEAERDTADDYLSTVAAGLRQHQLTVTVERLEGPTADAIVECARTLGADMILLTTHGRAGLERLLLGSVADAVLRHAPCPVLLVRQEHKDE